MKQISTILFFLCLCTFATAQITLQQVDDFEEDVMGWEEGGTIAASPGPPTIIATGGPEGAGDNYLENTSDGGSGPNSRWIMYNNQQWTGNYLSAGVGAISMFVRNSGDNAIVLRLAFGSGTNQFATIQGEPVPAGNDWQEYIFPIELSDLFRVSGALSAEDVMANVSEMRVLHNSSPAWRGESIEATIDIDKITALAPLAIDTVPLEISCIVVNVTENGGSNGSFTVAVANGNPPYTGNYIFGTDTIALAFNNNNSSTVSNLMAGNYMAMVNDATGQVRSCEINIDEPDPPIPDLELSCEVLDMDSLNQDGVSDVRLQITGGAGPFSMFISNGLDIIAFSYDGRDTTLSALTPGAYGVEVFDSLQTSQQCSFTVVSPPNETVVLNCQVTQNVEVTGASTGRINVDIESGTAPFTVQLIRPSGDTLTFPDRNNAAQFEGLLAGTYTVFVTDATGISNSCSLTITEPTPEAENYVAYLAGRFQSPANASRATGMINATLNGDTLTLEGSFGTFFSAVATEIFGGAHIHSAVAGRNGGVEFPLTLELSDDSTSANIAAADNQFILTLDQRNLLRQRQFYINIHTRDFPAGEIRGQMVSADADQVYAANLYGSNEMPRVLSAATGAIILERFGDSLLVSGSFNNLESPFDANIGMHLHNGLPGSNGPVLADIPFQLNDDFSGRFLDLVDIDTVMAAALNNRSVYANIHTDDNPGGEIRGQLTDIKSPYVMRARLLASSEVPRALSLAEGMAIVEFLNDSTYAVAGSFEGLEGTIATQIAGGAHIHSGYAGSNGPVDVGLQMNINEDSTSASFPFISNQFGSDNINPRLQGAFYINVHSNLWPGGEIRGQIIPEGAIVYDAYLSSIQEVPEAVSTALGNVKAVLTNNQLQLTGSLNGLIEPLAIDVAGGVHIHAGTAGAAGPIVQELLINTSNDLKSGRFPVRRNTYTIDSSQLPLLQSRSMYINVHSDAFRTGEIRGQLLPEANMYFAAPLSGASEIPAVESAANGMLLVELLGSNMFVSGGVRGLSSEIDTNIVGGAHLHMGLSGMNGNIFVPLNFLSVGGLTNVDFTVEQNTTALDAEGLEMLLGRGLYANIHTTNFATGELRGQLLPFATAYFTTSLSGLNQVPAVSINGDGGMKVELNGNSATISGAYSNLESGLDTSIGAHIHQGSVGSNGPVLFPLTPSFIDTSNTTLGMFQASDNIWSLDSTNIASLFDNDYYANVHAVNAPMGALRGQILPEINRFPSASEIQLPEDSSVVVISPLIDVPFIAAWTQSRDINKIVYKWQVSLTDSFEAPILENTGDATELSLDLQLVYDLLDSLGIPDGDTTTVFHRVLATDGALINVGATATAFLFKDMITNVFLPSNLETNIYPNPTSGYLNVTLDRAVDQILPIEVMDMTGRVYLGHELPAGNTNFELELSQLPSGQYVLRVANQWRLILKN